MCYVVAALCCLSADAVIIDRIAVIVGNTVIKDSDIDRDIRLTAFLNGDKLDFSEVERRKSAQRLIDQTLIRREIQMAHYPPPSPAEVQKLLEQMKQQRSGASPAEYGITEQEIEGRIRWQMAVLHFIDERFRPGVLITDQETQDYYRAHASGFRDPKTGKPLALDDDDVRDQIQDILAAPQVDRQFNDWLKDARERAKVEYREAALE